MGRKFKNFLLALKDVIFSLGIIAISLIIVFSIVYLIDLDEQKHIKSCSICHSTNVSKVYTDKRGLLSNQKLYYCYNCNREYNADLLIVEYKPEGK